MPATITTEVYTLAELVERGDEGAVDRALTWMSEAWDDVAVAHVSEQINETLRDVAPGLEWWQWDYYRGYVEIRGDFRVADTRNMEPTHPLYGPVFPGHGRVSGGSLNTRRARDYGRDLWLDLTEDAPFSWASGEYDALCEEVVEWVREVEARLTRLMIDEMEYMTSREKLLDCAEANGYTFTADGERFG
jgi:hypothetical protein